MTGKVRIEMIVRVSRESYSFFAFSYSRLLGEGRMRARTSWRALILTFSQREKDDGDSDYEPTQYTSSWIKP
jgi:hypothetical protein